MNNQRKNRGDKRWEKQPKTRMTGVLKTELTKRLQLPFKPAFFPLSLPSSASPSRAPYLRDYFIYFISVKLYSTLAGLKWSVPLKEGIKKIWMNKLWVTCIWTWMQVCVCVCTCVCVCVCVKWSHDQCSYVKILRWPYWFTHKCINLYHRLIFFPLKFYCYYYYFIYYNIYKFVLLDSYINVFLIDFVIFCHWNCVIVCHFTCIFATFASKLCLLQN